MVEIVGGGHGHRKGLAEGLHDALCLMVITESQDGGRVAALRALQAIMVFVSAEFKEQASHPVLERLFRALLALDQGYAVPMLATKNRVRGRHRPAESQCVQRGLAAAAVEMMIRHGGETAKPKAAAEWVAKVASNNLRELEDATRTDTGASAEKWERLLQWREEASAGNPQSDLDTRYFRHAVSVDGRAIAGPGPAKKALQLAALFGGGPV